MRERPLSLRYRCDDPVLHGLYCAECAALLPVHVAKILDLGESKADQPGFHAFVRMFVNYYVTLVLGGCTGGEARYAVVSGTLVLIHLGLLHESDIQLCEQICLEVPEGIGEHRLFSDLRRLFFEPSSPPVSESIH
jgi:hypothetical protein